MAIDITTLVDRSKPVLAPGSDSRSLAEYLLALGRWSSDPVRGGETPTDPTVSA